jgi:hypothetical protein
MAAAKVSGLPQIVFDTIEIGIGRAWLFAVGRVQWSSDGERFRVVTPDGSSDWLDYMPLLSESAWRVSFPGDPRSALRSIYLLSPDALAALSERLSDPKE